LSSVRRGKSVTVDELIDILEELPGHLPVVIEAASIGEDDRTTIHDVQKAIYNGIEEVHLIAADGIRDR
jgi:hypothetical protein